MPGNYEKRHHCPHTNVGQNTVPTNSKGQSATNHDPILDSPLTSQSGSLGQLKVDFCAFKVLGRHAGQDELNEELIVVQRSQVNLAALMGLSITEFLNALFEKTGYEVFLVREQHEFNVGFDVATLLRCGGFKQKY